MRMLCVVGFAGMALVGCQTGGGGSAPVETTLGGGATPFTTGEMYGYFADKTQVREDGGVYYSDFGTLVSLEVEGSGSALPEKLSRAVRTAVRPDPEVVPGIGVEVVESEESGREHRRTKVHVEPRDTSPVEQVVRRRMQSLASRPG